MKIRMFIVCFLLHILLTSPSRAIASGPAQLKIEYANHRTDHNPHLISYIFNRVCSYFNAVKSVDHNETYTMLSNFIDRMP